MTAEAFEAAMEELGRNDVVTYSYTTPQGKQKEGRGVVCKANRGGIRILPYPPEYKQNPRKLRVFLRGSVQTVNRDGGALRWRTTVGERDWEITPTGETSPVKYRDRRGGWYHVQPSEEEAEA